MTALAVGNTTIVARSSRRYGGALNIEVGRSRPHLLVIEGKGPCPRGASDLINRPVPAAPSFLTQLVQQHEAVAMVAVNGSSPRCPIYASPSRDGPDGIRADFVITVALP